MLDDAVQEIQKVCDSLLTKEQLAYIRLALANYALCAVLDSDVRAEAERACSEQAS